MMYNPLGVSEFPGITASGGTFMGLPVITSQYMPAGTIILASASEIFLADDGQATVDASTEASLEMAAPASGGLASGSGGPETPMSAAVSLWQTNSIGIRAERYINWAPRRAGAVQYLTGVAYVPTPMVTPNGTGE
jgi:hypothetical protein